MKIFLNYICFKYNRASSTFSPSSNASWVGHCIDILLILIKCTYARLCALYKLNKLLPGNKPAKKQFGDAEMRRQREMLLTMDRRTSTMLSRRDWRLKPWRGVQLDVWTSAWCRAATSPDRAGVARDTVAVTQTQSWRSCADLNDKSSYGNEPSPASAAAAATPLTDGSFDVKAVLS